MTKTPTPYRKGSRKDEARLRYADWLATPESQRRPATQQLLAKELGVARSTLSSWSTLPLIRSIVSDWRNTYKGQFSSVMDAMFRRARNGNVAAARLLAEVFGELSPTKIEQTNIGDSPFGSLLTELRDMRWKPLEGEIELKAIEGGKRAQ